MNGLLKRFTGTSEPDRRVVVSTTSGTPKRLLRVGVAYSSTPAYTGTDLTVKIVSGAGPQYNYVIQSGTNNTRYFSYIPTEPIILKEDDHIEVSAPSAGTNITSSVEIVTEEYHY